jgi:hypothetical protein
MSWDLITYEYAHVVLERFSLIRPLYDIITIINGLRIIAADIAYERDRRKDTV